LQQYGFLLAVTLDVASEVMA